MTTTRFVDIHIIQTVPPSNLNRDDAGSPKQAVYGGTRRARVSSQAWKRATRKAFARDETHQQAIRTRRLAAVVADRIESRTGLDLEQSTRLATSLLTPLGIKPGKKAGDLAYLLFLGRHQIESMVDVVVERHEELAGLTDDDLAKALKGSDVTEILKSGHPLDVALFGRMIADNADLNVDAAVQVAHAISTHSVETQFDYFTAVDDAPGVKADGAGAQTGAGMIGFVEFNSATLYRYATVGVEQLVENLGGSVGDAADAVVAFIAAFALEIPSGHQNSFAHRTLPHLLVVSLRPDQPVNLVSAFEKPLGHGSSGFAAASIVGFVNEYEAVAEWVAKPTTTFVVGNRALPDTEQLGSPISLAELLDAVRESLNPGGS